MVSIQSSARDSRGVIVHDEFAACHQRLLQRHGADVVAHGAEREQHRDFSFCPQSATIARPLASSVLSLCMTPLGGPVVPLVNARYTIWSGCVLGGRERKA